RHLPAGAKVGLQERPGTSGAWTTVARTRRIEHGSFTLRWTVPQKSGLTLQLRAVALRHGRVLAASKPQIDPLAPPPTACAPPPKPGMVPLGDGVVQGGLYWEGGPAPGQGPNCWSRAYAVSATDSRGKVMATQEVAAGNGYTLILPAG